MNEGYSVSAVAKLAGVPRQRLYGMAANGKIKTVRLSGGLVIMADEANRILKSKTLVKNRDGKTRIVFEELV